MPTICWKTLVEPGTVAHVARTRLATDATVPFHDHDFMEVYWIEEGVVRQSLNGSVWAMEAGDAVWLFPEDRHSLRGVADATAVNVAFPARIGRELLRRYHPDFMARKASLRLWLDAETRGRLSAAVRASAGDVTSRLFLDRVLVECLCAFERQTRQAAGGRPLPPWLESALRQIADPEHFRHGPQGFVLLCGRSHAHVARVARELLGRSVSDVVNAARMAWAARALALDAMDIVEVAFDCGFESLSHFYRVFRAAHGMSPRRYRLRAHGTVEPGSSVR